MQRGFKMAKRLIIGKNDLLSSNSPILNQWDYEKNIDISPEQISYSSTRQVWWKCDNGHSWQASIENRYYSSGQCPICNKQRVVVGINDFASLHPDLLQEWDFAQNTEDPSRLSETSTKSVWWKCDKGHTWKTSVGQRVKQAGCPYCRGRKIWPGYNDFATLYPNLLREWDYSLNDEKPTEIAPADAKKYHWICPKGHKYEAAISSRTRLGTGCPYCASQKVLPGFNDFESLHPDLAKGWDYEKNGTLKPSDFCEFSGKSVWWKCKKGHSWKTMIESRSRGYGCPICAKEYKTSIPEQALFFYIRSVFPDAINNYKTDWLGKSELDVFIPSLNIAVEFDGRVWHKEPAKDIEKNQLCSNHGIRVLRVREPGIPLFNDCIGLEKISYDSLSKAINQLLVLLGIESPSINVEDDLNEIYGLMQYREKEQSIAKQYPDIVAEWDYENNSVYLSPDTVNCNSKIKVFWVCPQGHHYEARVEHRTRVGSGCPYCAGKKVMSGFNDIASKYPELICEWSEDNSTSPDAVYMLSTKKYLWECKQCGHKWNASVYQRVKIGTGCPVCAMARRKEQVTINSKGRFISKNAPITISHPEIAKEWNYSKNGDLSPESCSYGSERKVWWLCPNGHSYQTMIKSRTKHNYGCPICLIASAKQ